MTPSRSRALLIPPLSKAQPGSLYEQIVDGVRREVSEGRLAPGTALPSFRALAEDLLVSVITVKRAYEELEREGIVVCRQGLGTFVADRGDGASREAKIVRAREHLREALREAREAGLSDHDVQKLWHAAFRSKGIA